MLDDTQCGFHPGNSTTDQNFTLQQIFVKSWEYAKNFHTCFVDFKKAYDRAPREKLWGVFAGARCWRPPVTGRQVTVFLLRSNCVRVGRELNQGRSPLVLDSDKDACCNCFSLHNLHQRYSNYSPRAASSPPTSLIRPTKYLANFFINFTFPTVDSSATALTAACHANRTVSSPPVARQSRIRPSGQNVWPSLPGRNEVRWRPRQEASRAPQCSNLRSFGSKYIALKKVVVTILGLFGVPRSALAPPQWFDAQKIVPPLLRRNTPDLHELNRQLQPSRGREGFLRWVHSHCDTSRQSAQRLNSQSPECGITSPRNWESTDINISVSAICPEFPYESEASPAG